MAALPKTGRATFGRQRTDLQAAANDRGRTAGPEEKTAEAIRQQVAREIDQLLRVVFCRRGKTGRLDLEAAETAARAAMHRAGPGALTELPQLAAPGTEQERAIGRA